MAVVRQIDGVSYIYLQNRHNQVFRGWRAHTAAAEFNIGDGRRARPDQSPSASSARVPTSSHIFVLWVSRNIKLPTMKVMLATIMG